MKTGAGVRRLRRSFPDTMVLGGVCYGAREQHERVKRMDRWAGKLLGHKAVVVAILVVIAGRERLGDGKFWWPL